MTLAIALTIAFSLAFAGSAWLSWRRHTFWQDHPGERSLHEKPVPRSGGIAIWTGVLGGVACGASLWTPLFDPWLLLAASLLFIVALWDDIRPVSPVIRLMVQCVTTLFAVTGAGLYLDYPGMPAIWMLVSAGMFLWGINLYNFMDGMDGFAGGMAVFGFGGLCLLAYLQGDTAFAGVCAVIVAATAGFLVLNFPPAKLFMGDSGSTILGFAMVSLGILGWKRGIYPVWVPLVLFSPFWIDASLTLAKRAWCGEKLWMAHRQHYYQRWVLAGLSHRSVVLLEYGLMATCLFLVVAWQMGLAGYNESSLLLSLLLLYGVVIVGSERFFKRRQCNSIKDNANP